MKIGEVKGSHPTLTITRRNRGLGGQEEQDRNYDQEEQEEDEPDQRAHYLLSDGKTYIVILCLIVLCGGIVVSNIFFPNRDRDKKNNNSEGK